jgi:hypothetical protein
MDQSGSDLERDRVSSAASELVWQRYQELKAKGWADHLARHAAACDDVDLAAAYGRGCGASLARYQQRQGQAPTSRADLATFGLPTRHFSTLTEVEKRQHSPWLRRVAPGEPEIPGRTYLHKLSGGPDGGFFEVIA